jgi:predicted nucleotidyltransferase
VVILDKRLSLYEEIRTLFLTCEEVGKVELYGSLANGGFDRFADIDVRVDVTGSDNAASIWKAVELFKGHFDVHFHDWAGSLLPDEFVVSFYLKDLPIYWNIDQKCPTLTRAQLDNDEVAHRLKPWAITCKYLMRGCVGDKHVRSLAGRVMPE